MHRCRNVFFLFFFAAMLAGCGTTPFAGRVHSFEYQEEASSRTPGYNLAWGDSLDNSVAQRVNQFNRSETVHIQQHNYVQRLTKAQELDKAAQKLGREPGSLFRQ